VLTLTLHATRENGLRLRADQPTIRMLDIWITLCIEKIGSPIEVMFCDRKEYPYHDINTHGGQLNSSIPQSCQDRIVLMLLLESVKTLDLVIVTHELGHWILKLQGFKTLGNLSERRIDSKESYGELSSLCTHPALFMLQRKLGHDPQKMIENRVNHDIAFLKSKVETNDEKTNIEDALYYADDLINCSESNRIGLARKLSNKLPKIAKFTEQILEIKATKDLSKPEVAWDME
jgi:hypothetical protein